MTSPRHPVARAQQMQQQDRPRRHVSTSSSSTSSSGSSSSSTSSDSSTSLSESRNPNPRPRVASTSRKQPITTKVNNEPPQGLKKRLESTDTKCHRRPEEKISGSISRDRKTAPPRSVKQAENLIKPQPTPRQTPRPLAPPDTYHEAVSSADESSGHGRSVAQQCQPRGQSASPKQKKLVEGESLFVKESFGMICVLPREYYRCNNGYWKRS